MIKLKSISKYFVIFVFSSSCSLAGENIYYFSNLPEDLTFENVKSVMSKECGESDEYLGYVSGNDCGSWRGFPVHSKSIRFKKPIWFWQKHEFFGFETNILGSFYDYQNLVKKVSELENLVNYYPEDNKLFSCADKEKVEAREIIVFHDQLLEKMSKKLVTTSPKDMSAAEFLTSEKAREIEKEFPQIVEAVVCRSSFLELDKSKTISAFDIKFHAYQKFKNINMNFSKRLN